jgi:hypothetical protein
VSFTNGEARMTDSAAGVIQGALDALILEGLAGAVARLLDAES